ncbi:hypothetical protein Tco_0155768 [Tanacetum coccineum]
MQVPSDVTLVARINNIDSSAYEADGTQSSVVVRDKDARIQKKSNGLVISENGMEATDDFVCCDPLDMSDEEVQSNDEKKRNSKVYALTGLKAKSDRSKSKTISYKEVWENTDWKRKNPFFFSSDEESGDENDTKGVNDKDESSQATPKGQSSQAKAPRPKFGTWTAAEGSKSKGKRRVGGRLNKDGEFPDEEIRSLGEKLKDADDKIKEGTLNLDDGTDAMTVVFGKEKGGYARGVGSGVTYKKYFDLPRSRQATDERIELLQTQLDNERRERQEKDTLVKKLSTEMKEKDVLVNKLSNEMSETKGMLSQLMNQLTAQGAQLNLSYPLQVPSDVTPVAHINNIDSSAYEADETQSSVVLRDKDARIQKKSNGLVISENGMEAMEPVKTVGTKKMPKSRETVLQFPNRKQICPPAQKSNTVAFGTVYKADGKQMLHNQELPNDCYKVSIDESVVDAACVPDVGNNGLKTVKDGVGGFFAWPKNQVVIEEDKVTPPTTIQKISDDNSAPKLQHLKRKSYVSRETMQRQARTAKSQKSYSHTY